MIRSILLILSAILALFTTLAHTKDDRLRMYAFTSKDCNGPPAGGNIDVKRQECMHIPGGALSIRPLAHKHQKWVQDVNQDQAHCEIFTFTQYGCFKDYLDQSRDLPEFISDCIEATDQPILSVSFNCSAKAHEPKAKIITNTSTWYEIGTATIWVSEDNSFVSVHQRTTYTKTSEIISTIDTKSSTTHTVWVEPTTPPVVIVTVTVEPSATAQTTVTMIVPPVVIAPTTIPSLVMPAPPDNPSMKTITLRDGLSPATAPSHMDAEPINRETDNETDDETEQDTQRLVARGRGRWKGPRKGVWMLHPWTMGLLCYDCYAKSSTNTHKFECRSGPFNPIDCGEMPASPTVTEIVTVTPTVTLGLSEAPYVLEKRKSWHRRVTFEHPWFPGTIMCADAEWEKRGQSKSEIRIQKPGENMKKCNKQKDDQLQDIGVYITTTTVTTAAPPKTVYTSEASTKTVIVTPTSTPTLTLAAITTTVPSGIISTVTISTVTLYSYAAPPHADL